MPLPIAEQFAQLSQAYVRVSRDLARASADADRYREMQGRIVVALEKDRERLREVLEDVSLHPMLPHAVKMEICAALKEVNDEP